MWQFTTQLLEIEAFPFIVGIFVLAGVGRQAKLTIEFIISRELYTGRGPSLGTVKDNTYRVAHCTESKAWRTCHLEWVHLHCCEPVLGIGNECCQCDFGVHRRIECRFAIILKQLVAWKIHAYACTQFIELAILPRDEATVGRFAVILIRRSIECESKIGIRVFDFKALYQAQ